MVLLPHVLSEVSNLAGKTWGIRSALRKLIEACPECLPPSRHGSNREEFEALGLTDAMLLHLCSLEQKGSCPTLLTLDSKLADAANAIGLSVIDVERSVF